MTVHTFVFSQEAAEKYGYIVGQDKQGNKFKYTAFFEGDFTDKPDKIKNYLWNDTVVQKVTNKDNIKQIQDTRENLDLVDPKCSLNKRGVLQSILGIRDGAPSFFRNKKLNSNDF